jgi:NADH:ubiquinone oxidoreductase subunit F (NADH-binding)
MTGRVLAGPPRDPSRAAHLRTHGALPLPQDTEARARLLDTVEESGLLGRGGAGFPIGRKMRSVAAGVATPVVLANGCEGEPASHKDSVLLTHAPHLVLDGLQVAAAAVGADEAHLVVHRGSPALPTVCRALGERHGADRTPVTVHELPARYVASEETALVHWLNGGDAKPTFTPPRPFERGVRGRPTLVNNVETLAHVALVGRHGAQWYRDVGDADEPGTMLLSLSGPPDVSRVVEVPTGTTIEAALTGAGVDVTAASAVLVGGYFGTWLPLDVALGTPLTHRGLRAVGGALGAGIVSALPADRCGVAETARVASYLATQSAGQCGPCVNGLPAIADAMRRLARGPWDDRRLGALDRWLTVVPGRGACRFPDGATRFVASALTTFGADVAMHRSGHPGAASRADGWLPLPAPSALDPAWR